MGLDVIGSILFGAALAFLAVAVTMMDPDL